MIENELAAREAARLLGQEVESEELVERTAKAIFQANAFGLRPLPPAADLTELWNAALMTSRVRYRNQALAALAASGLLDRVQDLEQRIAAARNELVIYGGEMNGPALARKVNRVDRMLSKPLPVEQSPRMKENQA